MPSPVRFAGSATFTATRNNPHVCQRSASATSGSPTRSSCCCTRFCAAGTSVRSIFQITACSRLLKMESCCCMTCFKQCIEGWFCGWVATRSNAGCRPAVTGSCSTRTTFGFRIRTKWPSGSSICGWLWTNRSRLVARGRLLRGRTRTASGPIRRGSCTRNFSTVRIWRCGRSEEGEGNIWCKKGRF
uniref:(northern house mosquito) hypothetical protein n=1 Tax=Culex pipiens TaxID=7175 RepID=A0A8D8I224_CULPI